jgi:hypothetical protein
LAAGIVTLFATSSNAGIQERRQTLGTSGRCVRCCALWLLAAALIAGPAVGQPLTATLLLEVTDSTGGVLSGAWLSVIHLGTAVERVATTSAAGTAVVPLLPPGDYVVTASMAGFRKTSVQRFHLEAGAKRSLVLVLQPGPVTEIVTVSADAARGRTGTAAAGEIFDGQVLLMTPVASRDVGEFTWQAPGAAPPAPGSRLSGEGGTPANVSGARETSNNFRLDGVDNNDLFLNRVLVTPSLDAVQEFSLVTSSYDAEYGRNAGGQVNVVLKSGGERLSGSAYEYFRDRSLESRGRFDAADEPEPFRRRHQFGATMGGRLGRLPGFFFGAIEGVRDRSAETRLARVPTAAERAGDFRASGLTIRDPFTGEAFAGNLIPTSLLDPVGARLLALYPLPNRESGAGNFGGALVSPHDTWQMTAKADHRLRGRIPVFFRYTLARDDRRDAYPGPARNLPGFGTDTLDVGHNVGAGLSQTFGQHVMHDLRFGWNRLRRDVVAANSGTDAFTALGMNGPALGGSDLGVPGIVVSGVDTVGDDVSLPVIRGTQTYQVTDTVGVERGRHFVKTGAEVRHYRSDGYLHLFSRGQLNFLGAFTGSGVADLLLGLPTVTLLAENDNPQALRTTALNAFVQDDWRVNDRLTVNAGVRYEFNSPPVDARDGMAVFDPATNSLSRVGVGDIPRSGVLADLNNVAPRVGLSWAMRDSGRLLLRAGYGRYYDSGTLIENSALYFNPPYFSLQLFVPGGDLSPTAARPFPTGAGFPPALSVNTLARDFSTAQTDQGSLAIEGRVRGIDWSARWVGAAGSHLVRKRNLNQPSPGPGPVEARRPVQGYGDILLVESEARSVYHALQLRIEHRQARGLWLRGAYTWGKSIDDQSAFLASDGNDNTPQNSQRPDLERGLSDFDVRHRAVVAVIWQVPGTVRHALLRDWQVSALVSAQSGRPFTPRVTSDGSNTGNLGGQFGYDRPNEVAAGTAGAVTYDGRAFLIAPAYTFGDAGRNVLIGPPFASADIAISKALRLGGGTRLELRAEIYNLLDRTNPGLPDSFVDRPTFGQSLSASPGRQAQLALRFTFGGS